MNRLAVGELNVEVGYQSLLGHEEVTIYVGSSKCIYLDFSPNYIRVILASTAKSRVEGKLLIYSFIFRQSFTIHKPV